MPRTKLCDKYCMPKKTAVKVKPPNMLRDLFDRYMKAQGITSEELGRRLGGMTPDSVRMKKHSGKWDSAQIREWCKALNITDPAELGKAILYE